MIAVDCHPWNGGLYLAILQNGPATQPFSIQRPEVSQLSSPQLDMLFDVMSFLYHSIPAMELMENVRAQALAKAERASDQTAAGTDCSRPTQLTDSCV
jgi:hypothetical protein